MARIHQQPAKGSKSRSAVWPTLRMFILVVNFYLLVNFLLYSDSAAKNDTKEGGKDSARKATLVSHDNLHAILNHHESHLLSQCHETAFDLRNERQRKTSPDTTSNHICSKLPLGATASSVWQKYREKIYEASLHPDDKDRVHAPWTRDLLDLLSPRSLERGLRRAPNHRALQNIMKIIQTKLNDPQNAPPLEVAIVGGSVTEGSGCDRLPPNLNISSHAARPQIRGQPCAWPFRLQRLVDAIMGEGVIRIHNLAVGGTNSALAVPVLDYWLFPQNSPLLERGPDVIVNAYAANDNLPSADKRGDDTNTTGGYEFFLNGGFKRAQDFIRTSLFSRPCQEDPLVLFVDEYLGNQHNFIIGELFRFEAVDLLTDWYGTAGAVSSAQVVRRYIYANTREEIFSAQWTTRKWPWRVDVHFGMPGHVFIAWTVAYSMLTMALNFCEEETGRVGDHSALLDDNNKGADTNPRAIATDFVPANVLQLVEEEVPPTLNTQLLVSDVATEWNNDATARKTELEKYCTDSSKTAAPTLPCSFAFVAAPMGTVRNAGALNGYMKQFVVKNDGWNGEQDMRNGWQNKLGYVAGTPGASVLLRIDKTPNSVKTITLHTLKSYGEKWAESKAKFSLQWNHEESGTKYSTSFEILGYHNQTTSIAYPFVLDLGPDHIAEKGSTLDLQIDLVGGTTFKINSMMICSR